MMQFHEPEIVMVDGRRLAYEEVSPSCPRGTIVLLVGLGAKRQGWYKQLPAFGRAYRTIALDYRDVGDSDEAREPYTIQDLAQDTIAVMRARDQTGTYYRHLDGWLYRPGVSLTRSTAG